MQGKKKTKTKIALVHSYGCIEFIIPLVHVAWTNSFIEQFGEESFGFYDVRGLELNFQFKSAFMKRQKAKYKEADKKSTEQIKDS